MSAEDKNALVEIYRREMLSFLQYVGQTSPYAVPTDRRVAERVQELARSEAKNLEGFADYLDKKRITLPHLGAFPSVFTNYNFVPVSKLLPQLVIDHSRGLATLEREATEMPFGDERTWIEKLAATKRLHLTEMEKLRA